MFVAELFSLGVETMNLTQFYDEVSRKTDTSGTQINVTETKRVLSEAFRVLATLPAGEVLALLAKGVQKAESK